MEPTDGDPEFVRDPDSSFTPPEDPDGEPRDDDGEPPYRPTSAARPFLIACCAAAALGAVLAAESTTDFIQHLDRQVHSIHCSVVPGAGLEVGESGCRTVMMSPYSSFFRESIWGGIPVSLWALAVFAFLLYRSLVLAVRGSASQAEARFLLAATGLPLGMSAIYAFLSMAKVGATCQVCLGIYLSSAAAFVFALIAQRRTPADRASSTTPPYALWFGEGVGFVAVLTLVFLMATPKSNAAGTHSSCGTLVKGDDPAGVMVPLQARAGRVPAIEVLDPLCPACRAFDARLRASDLRDSLALQGVLFPLDSTCNWMVTETLHPGACAVSEAVLCAEGLGDEKNPRAAQRVLAWAFENQPALRALAAKDDAALRRRIEDTFPNVKGCLGGYPVKNKLTKSLRWAVANALPVLTPQLFVRDERMCDENTDLGLEYTLHRMIAHAGTKEASR